MKQTQGSYFSGYVTILIEGNTPETFFQICAEQGITVWDVKKKAPDACEGNIKLTDLQSVKKLRRQTGYRLSFVNKKGYPFLVKRLISKKPLLIALLLSILFIFVISNMVWEVKVTGVPKEIEEKIVKQLNEYGVHPGSWMLSLDSPKEIQQNLINDVPELLWVGVDQKGTTLFLDGVEKIVVKKEAPEKPRNLVATKKGVIKNMYVARGVPKVAVNDYVKPGDVLVSGILDERDASQDSEDEEEEKESRNLKLVPAEGEIIANTWYEVSVTVPLNANREVLTGEKKKKYFIKIGDVQLPIWGFKDPPFQETHQEIHEQPINFFKWELPIKFVETTISEKIYEDTERTKEEAIQAGIEQAKHELQLELGPDAKILSEKLLHETTESGKVRLDLYISAEENIANEEPLNEPLSQGD